MKYGEGATEPATPQRVKSAGGTAGAAKRVVIDARESGTTTGRYIDKLVENLHALKPKQQIVVLTKPERVGFMKQAVPDFEVVGSNYKEFSFGEQYGLVWQLYGLRADLVHFGMTQQPILYFGKSVTTVHDLTTARWRNPAKNPLIFKPKQWVYRAVIKIIARKSARIITPSAYVRQDLARYAHVKKDKITVIHEAAGVITEKPAVNERLVGEQFLLYTGRPLPHKNLKRLIEAFIILRQSRPELKLVLAGARHPLHERLEQDLHEHDVDGVILTGFVSEGQLRWLYENCAAYVFPSLSEGFGLPGLEAMAHGAPVAASDATSLPEIYGGAALYFNPQDPADIAAKINRLLIEDELRDRLIKAGAKQVKKYSWRRTAEQTLELYQNQL